MVPFVICNKKSFPSHILNTQKGDFLGVVMNYPAADFRFRLSLCFTVKKYLSITQVFYFAIFLRHIN